MSENPIRRHLDDPSPLKSLDGRTITCGTGWSFGGWPADVPLPQMGQIVQLETINFSTVVGAQVDGVWQWRKTDAEIEQERADWLADYERRKRERLAEMRPEYIGREEHLPKWGQQRLARFRKAGGEEFELDGWGYELVICELAAAYVVDGVPAKGDYTLPQTVKAIDEAQGCSGNQHDCARLLARLVIEGREAEASGGVMAGLAPLTGSADYSPSVGSAS